MTTIKRLMKVRLVTTITRKLKALKRQAAPLLSSISTLVNLLTRLLQAAARVEPRHKIAFLIIASFLTDLIFTLFEFDKEIYKFWHPFYDGMTFSDGRKWDGSVTDANFAYGFFAIGSRGLMFLAGWLAITYGMYAKSFLAAFWVELFDMPDYYLFRNAEWITGSGFEYNFIKIFVVVSIVYYEWKKLKYTGSLES